MDIYFFLLASKGNTQAFLEAVSSLTRPQRSRHHLTAMCTAANKRLSLFGYIIEKKKMLGRFSHKHGKNLAAIY